MKKYNNIFYLAILLLSVGFIFFGNRIVSGGLVLATAPDDMFVMSANILEILHRGEETFEISEDFSITNIFIEFLAEITSGDFEGEKVTAHQNISGFLHFDEVEVSFGNRVLLLYDEYIDIFQFMDFYRINYIIILGVILFILIVIFARKKGFNAFVSLALTCLSLFLVFVPSILAGYNIYIAAIIICAYSVVTTLLIVVGPNKKTVASIVGCMGGILFAAALMFNMDILLNLTGLIDQEAGALLALTTENPIELRAIIFAGVVIGSTGAIMDVAMSISSSLWEVKIAGQNSTFFNIFRSGIEIGKDILGTMLNTLILAYIGSSLPLILLLTANTTSFIGLFNMELVIVEFLRAIIGSFGMLLSIPLTACFCGLLYREKYRE